MKIANRYLLYFFAFIALLTAVSCGDGGSLLPPDHNNTSDTDTVVTNMLSKTPVLLWIEAAANFERLGTAEKMAAIFKKVADMGVTGIVVDVKGITGLVSYNSSIAAQLKTWNGFTQADNFDYLGNAITEAKKAGLKVFVSMSVFAEGMNYNGTKYGKVFNDATFSTLQSQVVNASGTVKKITDVYSYGMLNPAQPAAQAYELSLIKEVVKNYNFDGFVLDYCRYYDICADFSDYSLNSFKEWANLSSVSTTDIVKSWITSYGSVVPYVTGTYYKKWIEYRAHTIHDFVSDARDAVKEIKPHLAFCSYSGAWYDSYYYVGVNWASKTYDPSANGYSEWATSTYKNTGYAELIDMFMMGNYTPALNGSGWWTVSGQITGAKNILNDANVLYGGIDIGNTSWSDLSNMHDAITMILQRTSGIMLFDLVHIDDPANNQFNKQLYNDIGDAIADGLNK
jgi:uncharacterized lipoprotein YddW (UPF0748 family)